jgi:adenylate cyclase
MKVSALFWYRLRHLLIFLIWWNISIRLFIYLRFAGQLDAGESVAKAISIIRDNQSIITICACVISIFTWLMEEFAFNKLLKRLGTVNGSIFRSLSYLVLFTVFSLFAGLWYNVVYHDVSFWKSLGSAERYLFNDTWLFFFIIVILTNWAMNLFVAAENHLGKGNINKILSGAYRVPQEEAKIFMFLDLVSSSRAAELLGHQRYSRFLQESFKEMSNLIIKHRATVYQYVGDEVVLVWDAKKPINYIRSLRFYFDLLNVWKEREQYYNDKYGITPLFTASLNSGKVMVAEVGEIKTEIAYHGDVLNTASRVQKVCKVYQQPLVVTQEFVTAAGEVNPEFEFSLLDDIELPGKENKVKIFGVTSNLGVEKHCCYESYYRKCNSYHKRIIGNTQ